MIPNILCIDDDEISLMLNEFLCELTVFGKKFHCRRGQMK